MCHLPLFLAADFPDIALVVYNYLLMLAQFDIIPEFLDVYELLQIEVPDDFEDYHLENLENCKYEGTYTLSNLGSLFFIFIGTVMVGVILWLIGPCKAYCPKRIQKFKKETEEALYWNTYLRLFIEACLDVSIACMYNLNIVR